MVRSGFPRGGRVPAGRQSAGSLPSGRVGACQLEGRAQGRPIDRLARQERLKERLLEVQGTLGLSFQLIRAFQSALGQRETRD